jgi:hypothetical protein
MPRLKTCPACSRHVFVHETRCPFCAGDCSQESRAPIFAIQAGMSRAQRFAVVAAVAGQTALLGCNATDDPAPDPDPGPGQVMTPVYGAPIPPGGIQPPPSGAGGNGAIAGNGSQAGTGGVGVGQPVYGAPFVDAGPPQPMYGGGLPPVDAGVAGRGDEDGGTEPGSGG